MNQFNNLNEVEIYANSLLSVPYELKGKRIKGLKDWCFMLMGETISLKGTIRNVTKIGECDPKDKILNAQAGLIEKHLDNPKVIVSIIQCQIARAIQWERYGTLNNDKFHRKILKRIFKVQLIKIKKKK